MKLTRCHKISCFFDGFPNSYLHNSSDCKTDLSTMNPIFNSKFQYNSFYLHLFRFMSYHTPSLLAQNNFEAKSFFSFEITSLYLFVWSVSLNNWMLRFKVCVGCNWTELNIRNKAEGGNQTALRLASNRWEFEAWRPI